MTQGLRGTDAGRVFVQILRNKMHSASADMAKSMMGARLPIAVTCCLLFTPLVGAKAEQKHPAGSSGPTIKVGVREVLVPTVVTEHSGKYVTELDRADFAIFEDGVEQKIVDFSRPLARSVAQKPASDGTPDRLKNSASGDPVRTYLICLDSLHSSFENFARVRKALREFFSKEDVMDSQFALMALGLNLHVIVDSTRDPATILSAIDSKSFLKSIQDSEANNLARQTAEFNHAVELWCRGCDCANPSMDMANPGCPGLKARVRAMLLGFSERTALLDSDFLRQLLTIVHAMCSMPTQRTVVFVSSGFNRFPGEELYSILRAYGVKDPTLKVNPRDTQSDLEKVLRLAVRYNVRFYTLDGRGLYTSSAVAGSGQDASTGGVPSDAVTLGAMSVAWQNSAAMAELAHETGGAFFENSNDFLKGIRRAFDDDREQYVLAYIPSNSQMDGSFRRIRVRVKRKDLTVKAKTGYWATE